MSGKQWRDSKTVLADAIIKSKVVSAIFCVLCIAVGLFFIFFVAKYDIISRESASFHVGAFEKYVYYKNSCEIHMQDGSVYDVYPHTETSKFRDKMTALKKGTELHLAVHPESGYVIELKANSEELLNFEASQKAIKSDKRGYVYIGIFLCVAGVGAVVCAVFIKGYEKKERLRQQKKANTAKKGGNSPALRHADNSVKCKILLEITENGYDICYRRVGRVNELVVNGLVYDEKKGLFEGAHKLTATVNGNRIEAGLDTELSVSYICFNGNRIAEEYRTI